MSEYWVILMSDYLDIVNLQSKLHSPVQVGPGVDFVFPLSQEQEEEQQEPPPKSTTSRHARRLRFGMVT